MAIVIAGTPRGDQEKWQEVQRKAKDVSDSGCLRALSEAGEVGGTLGRTRWDSWHRRPSIALSSDLHASIGLYSRGGVEMVTTLASLARRGPVGFRRPTSCSVVPCREKRAHRSRHPGTSTEREPTGLG